MELRKPNRRGGPRYQNLRWRLLLEELGGGMHYTALRICFSDRKRNRHNEGELGLLENREHARIDSTEFKCFK